MTEDTQIKPQETNQAETSEDRVQPESGSLGGKSEQNQEETGDTSDTMDEDMTDSPGGKLTTDRHANTQDEAE